MSHRVNEERGPIELPVADSLMSPCATLHRRDTRVRASRGVINAPSPRSDPGVLRKGKKSSVAGRRVATSNRSNSALDTAADIRVSPWQQHTPRNKTHTHSRVRVYDRGIQRGTLGFGSLRACETYKLPVLRIPPHTGHTSLHMRLRRRPRLSAPRSRAHVRNYYYEE